MQGETGIRLDPDVETLILQMILSWIALPHNPHSECLYA